jgi:hypothetical protein
MFGLLSCMLFLLFVYFRYILDNDYVDRDFDDDLSKFTESSTPVETPDE